MAFKDKPYLFLLFFFHLTTLFCVPSLSLTDTQVLLTLKNSLSDSSSLANWVDSTPPCNEKAANWNGVICNKGTVWGLQLENMGLTGKIDINILKELKDLRSISLMNNMLEGPMPELNKIGALKSVYLSNNKFSGEIPADAFDGMSSLKKVYLSQNGFTGPIPSSLARSSKLVELGLDGNKFDGQIPDFNQNFQVFNVSNNALDGSIPPSLSRLSPTSFSGNKGLCGAPLTESCNSPTPSPSPSPSPIPSPTTASPGNNANPATNAPNTNTNSPPSPPPDSGSKDDSGSSTVTIVSATVASVVAVVAIIFAVFFVLRKKQREESSIEDPVPSNLQKKSGIRESLETSSPSSTEAVVGGGGKKCETTKLSFVRDDREKFDLQDLLRASAEILGSGSFGSSYKAALCGGATMVVKRFKQMNNVGKEEFQEHMRRLGRLRHPNLLPLVAYYYRKEEKLLIADFVQKGSLAVHLHGYQSMGQPSLDWPTRLKIIKGVAKGLAYLYKELPSLISPHGHLKSSNVLLNESLDPLMNDYGLIPVINQESSQELMVAYKSPESIHTGRITKKTDVWGFGILILEILTGKFPANFLQQGKKSEVDLASWVHAVLGNSTPGESRNEVFDKDMRDTRNGEGEMMKLLKIGLACSEVEVEKRLDLKEAVERIEEIKERDPDEDFYSSYASDADFDVRSSRGKSDDFTFS